MKWNIWKSGISSFCAVFFICITLNFGQEIEFVPLFEEGDVDFHEMTWAGEIPGHPGNFMVLEQLGTFSNLFNEGSGWKKDVLGEVNAVRRGSIQNGAYSIAFHPGFRENGKFYLLYRSKEVSGKPSFLEEWYMHPQNLDQVEKKRTLMEIEQKNNHGSGHLVFGPDGYLWSSQSDHNGNSSALDWLGGKVLRIDVDNKDPGLEYAIPQDNPFVGEEGAREEIWARGFRVPWRMSFDPMTDELWLAEVGGSDYEEINLVKKGLDYGSREYEGLCNCSEYEEPLVALDRDVARSVTGGYVYRNNPSSEFYGKYIFVDHESSRVFAISKEGENVSYEDIGKAPKKISHLMIDSSGVWYALDWRKNVIYQLVHPEMQAGSPISVNPSMLPAKRKRTPGLSMHGEFLNSSRGINGRLIPYQNRNFSTPVTTR